MKSFRVLFSITSALVLFSYTTFAQDQWPKTINASDGSVINVYEWQPESFSNNELRVRAAISVLEEGKTDPVFGVAWLNASTRTNGNDVKVESIEINSIKLPGDISDDQLDDLRSLIARSAENWNISIPLSQLQAAVDLNRQQAALSGQINNTPPKIIYSSTPSILVLIDGAPKVQYNTEWKTDAVVNTPFTIVKNLDGKFYLYGGKHWYTAPAATGPYQLTTSVSSQLKSVEQKVNDAGKNDDPGTESDENTIYKIIVSTEPAELIQSKGEANFAAVEGSGLLYVSNSENDIFMDVNSQDYYVLLAGRWYKSKTLSGNWQYISADNLPADFAKIPEGSPKDNVLASVAGTEAAHDALEEAQVPQTAKVDRRNAKAEVLYDGQPEFEMIDGMDLAYATNTSASVIRWRGRYYSVDNGVWFESGSALGPWHVSVNRPYVVALIPPRYPVFHMKYVYIYDVTPDYVWMGYTPGYLNTFIYGPTIVYGTGYYYRPWYRHYYFPRPHTWGFAVRYNPWFGWGIGFSFSHGWFNGGFYAGSPYGYGGGWWGPRNYRPSYCWSPYRYQGGYYGRNSYVYNRSNYNYGYRSYNANNNIYRNRGGVVTRTNSRSYSPGRSRNDRGNWTYNNGNRGRNNNYQGNRVEEQNNNRPSRNYNNTGVNRTRPRGIEANPQYNNRNNNNGTSVNPARPDRIAPRDSRNTNLPNRDGNTQREPAIRERVRTGETQPRTNREYRPNNDSRSDQRTMPGRISQPQQRVVAPSQQLRTGGQRERSYSPPSSPRSVERRESVRPGSATRVQSGDGSRPARIYNGGNGGAGDARRRGN